MTMPRGVANRTTGLTRRRNDRGAILIHVAVALLGLLAFSAFSIDHGVMMLSRGQAQNAADAGALAAALYLAHDGGDQPGAQAIGVAGAQANLVFGEQPDVTLTDVTFPPCPLGAPGIPDTCVRVDVFRNQRAGGNPLPAFFSSLVGVPNQGVRATATAQVVSAGLSASCVLPFGIPDYWREFREDEAGAAADESPLSHPHDNDSVDTTNPDWDPDDTYDHYVGSGPGAGTRVPGGLVDEYLPASDGFQLDMHHGLRLRLKAGLPGEAINPGHFFPITLNAGETGASIYRNNIAGCNPAVITIPGTLPVEPGNMIGPTRQGMADLIAQDPGARWNENVYNPDTQRWGAVEGTGCHPNCSTPSGMSPRIRPVLLFNPDTYDRGRGSGRTDFEITRFAGFFIEELIGNDVVGYLTTAPAAGERGPLDDEGAFLRTVILVR